MLNFLSKTASILNNVESPDAKQAAAALEGVIMAHAARRSVVMTPEEVADFNDKLKAFLGSTLDSGKIPRGLKWRLLQLKDGHAQLTRQLTRLEQQRARGETPMAPAEPPGATTPVEMPYEMTHAEQSSADIVDEAELERKQQADAALGKDTPEQVELPQLAKRSPEPVELPQLAKRSPEPTEGPVPMQDEDMAPELARKPVVHEFEPDTADRPDVKVLSPGKVDLMMGKGQVHPKPQGTHAETWDEKLKRWMGMDSSAELLSDMIKIADKLDAEGHAGAADIIERVAAAAAEQYPSLNDTRKDLYDFKAHNQETMREVVKHEVEENRKDHHLKTHQGMAVSQTRHSPDMPGVMMKRVSDGVYQCPITNKLYDFQNGFTDANGNSRAGGSIKHQTPLFTSYAPPSRLFEGTLSRRK